MRLIVNRIDKFSNDVITEKPPTPRCRRCGISDLVFVVADNNSGFVVAILFILFSFFFCNGLVLRNKTEERAFWFENRIFLGGTCYGLLQRCDERVLFLNIFVI